MQELMVSCVIFRPRSNVVDPLRVRLELVEAAHHRRQLRAPSTMRSAWR